MPDKDPVYIVKLDAGKLSVRFEDWIEPNLLGLNTMDLKKVEIKDYSVTPMVDPAGRTQIVLARRPRASSSWMRLRGTSPGNSSQDLDFDAAKKSMVPRPMAADEELNVANLDALKSALEDLKIVDVERKPAAVPADLRVRKIDRRDHGDVDGTGFLRASQIPRTPRVRLEIFSNSGDITLQLADGARYILRFGVTTGESSAAEKAKKKGNAKSEKEDKAKDDSSPGMDRYLFVTADFNQNAIPKPVFEKLPEEKPAKKAPRRRPTTRRPTTRKPTDKKAGRQGGQAGGWRQEGRSQEGCQGEPRRLRPRRTSQEGRRPRRTSRRRTPPRR